LTTAFNTAEFDLAYQDGVELSYWRIARNKIIYRSVKKSGLAGLPILEVGCGRGIVTGFFLEKNVDCVGVELAEIKPMPGLGDKVITGKDALDFPPDFRQRFKAIMLLDVIEHIENDTDFVMKLLKAYSNVEYLIIAVPARKEIWSNFDDFYRHFRRYDLKMINDLMAQLNFEIKSERYFFNLVYLMIWLQSKFNTKRKLENPRPKGMMSRAINKIIASCFVLEYMITPRKLYGSSIICVARKMK
jgi:Methyltransferase domain